MTAKLRIRFSAKPTQLDSSTIHFSAEPGIMVSTKGPIMQNHDIIDVRQILQKLADVSSRPRYAFMVLNLISEAADASGRVGPMVGSGHQATPVRDWLSDALTPLARQHRRAPLEARVTARTHDDNGSASAQAVAEAVALQARISGKTNVSRAVSDLVKAGLVRRHYQGWRTAHDNRGGRRQAVYIVNAEALAALRRRTQLI